MILSVRTRFFLLIAVSLLLLAVWAGLFTLFSVENFQKTNQFRLCTNALQFISELITPPDPDGDASTPQPLLPFTEKEVRKMQEVLGNLHLGATGFVGLVGFEGNFICRPEEGRRPVTLSSLANTTIMETIRTAAATPGVPLQSEMKGRKSLFFVQEIPSRHCYAVILIYDDEIMTPALRLACWLMASFALAACAILMGAYVLTRRFTTSLLQLSDYARALPESDFLHATGHTPLLTVLTDNTRDLEVRHLAASFAFMEETLRDKVAELMKNVRTSERLHGELNAARDVQCGLLPRPLTDTAVPPRFALAASLEAAQWVGGDLYDFFFLDDDHLCFAVGDVSGKGMAAALFMGVTLTLLRPWARSLPEPDQLLERINGLLSRANSHNMFVTLLVGVLDLRTGELAYANGGHNPPLRLTQDGPEWLKDVSGPLIGVFPEAQYTLSRVRLEPGQSLFLYSDGVTEALNAHKELYSDAALFRIVQKYSDAAPQGLIDAVRRDLNAHVGDAPASDDVTMLVVRRQPLA